MRRILARVSCKRPLDQRITKSLLRIKRNFAIAPDAHILGGYAGTSPYLKRSLAREWTQDELDSFVEQGYRHPKVDVEYHLKERDVSEAMSIFEGFKSFAEAKTWGQVLWAHGRTGHLNEMAKLYFEMTREYKIRPTEPVFATMIKAMNRYEAYDAVFNMYEEEIKPREYLRPTIALFQHLFTTCLKSKNVDMSEKLWEEYGNHYGRMYKEELFTSRLLVACAVKDWPLVANICADMDASSRRLRVLGFRAIMDLIPKEGMPKDIERQTIRLLRTDPQYSVKPWKEKAQKIHFQSQVELFELIQDIAQYLEKEGTSS